jgi:hypothetical protein
MPFETKPCTFCIIGGELQRTLLAILIEDFDSFAWQKLVDSLIHRRIVWSGQMMATIWNLEG